MTAVEATRPALALSPLHEDFAARVSGIELSGELSRDDIGEIEAAFAQFSLLVFPDQNLDDAAQLALTRRLGEPEANHVILGETGKTVYHGTIGNVLEDGSTRGNADRRTVHQTGNNLWHTDSSFRPVPAMASIMSVHEVPEVGGATEFVSTRAAHARLPAARQAEIEPLIVVHDYVYSRNQVGAGTVKPSHAAAMPPVRHKLVRANPASGARNYFAGSHARGIAGRPEAEGRRLIDELLANATRPQDIYSHQWQPGELVIWDNRCLLHRGSGFDADKYRRYMRQTRVRGAGSTLDE